MVTYADAKTHQARSGETNDCAVLAVTVAADADYGDVLELMYKLGRNPREGTHLHIIWEALAEFGFTAVDETEKWVGKKVYSYNRRISTTRTGPVKTVITAERYLPKRHTYLVLTGGRSRTHILCVKRGRVQDWTAGRRNRVLHVWRIEPK